MLHETAAQKHAFLFLAQKDLCIFPVEKIPISLLENFGRMAAKTHAEH